MPESGKEEKDGCNRHAAGRETLPRQDQYKQRTHAEKTASEEENFFCLKRNRTRCFAFCGCSAPAGVGRIRRADGV